MKWIDESKAVLDYVLGTVPLLSLVFIIIAYFHTVHPRFAKDDELEKASLEIVALKNQLKFSDKNNNELTAAISSLKGLLSDNELQLKFVEQKYISLATATERADYLKNRVFLYFSKEDVISTYTKHSQELISESGETVDPSTIKAIDVNITGGKELDVYLIDAWSCGSGGCMGPLFIYYNGAYCFSAWAHSKTIDTLKKKYKLQCSKFSDDNRSFLSDFVGIKKK